MQASGVNGQLALEGEMLMIRRNGILAKAAFFGGGEKAVKVSALASVEFKKPSWLSRGFIHFVFSGTKVLEGNVSAASKNENAVIFSKKQLPEFEAFYSALLSKMG